MALPRQHMTQVKFHGTDIAEAGAKECLEPFRVIADELGHESDLNGVFPDVFFVAPSDHFLAHRERQTCGAGKRSAGGRKNQLLDSFWIFQREQLRYPP